MKKDYGRKFSPACPTCANTTFSFDENLDEDDRIYTCGDCGQRFSYNDIMAANGELIQNTIEEMKNEIVSDMQKDIKKLFRKLK
ncbi:ECs_2282 family putative zinc-binding protein [Tropicibacter naphthalenivorans]|uniref:ECs_2282 family putative zinc-binding protein n=1 Tax=Tropicibacter naphthalenivorans TaxID=441103 RepID=UPI001180BC5D|nr:hypothetical protein [Tropicibacter naphthalenivorans]